MSYLTFPLTLGSSTAFPLKQTPRFNTLVQVPATGRGELRISTTQFPLYDFEIDISYLTGDAQGVNTPWQQLINFYMGVQGAANNWYFLHPYDNNIGTYTVAGTFTSGHFITALPEQVIQTSTGAAAIVLSVTPTQMTIGAYTGSPDNSHTWVGQQSGAVFTASALPVLASSMAIATGDGTTAAFSMIRTLVTGGAQDLIQNFVNPPSIYVAGVLQTPVTNYTGPDLYGTITFTGGHIPTLGQTISWTGSFLYLCRFIEDSWSTLQEDQYQLWTIQGLRFRSVLQ